MNKRIILITIILLVTVIVFSVYMTLRTTPLLSVEQQIPAPTPHVHTAPDGTVVKHIHNYNFTPPDTNTDKVKQPQRVDTKHPIQRAWERLDLAVIKKKYQPYTITEMKEMWNKDYLDRFGPNLEDVTAAEKYYPLDKWLEDLMDLGHPFMHIGHYQLAFERWLGMAGPLRKTWQEDPHHITSDGTIYGGKAGKLQLHLLSPETSWEEYINITNKFSVVRLMNVLRAKEIDPDVEGGFTNLDGSFLPFSPNLVHVYISPETGRTNFIGASLTSEEEDALVNYGIAPKGMSVVYIDEKKRPLPPDKVPSRLYEKRMKDLVEAQALIQQQIEEHEKMLELDALLNPPDKGKQTDPFPHKHPQDHEHDHGHETPQTPDEKPEQQRRQPDAKRTPPPRKIPPELRKPDAVNQWFKELQLLHGGQLPKDLQELRKIITELEKIREEGEAMMKPPEHPKRPTPPLPPEGSPPPPPNEDD